MKKQAVSFSRPPGQRAPDPAARSYGSGALAALEDQARRGESIWREAAATLLGRGALPRAGWGHRQAQHSRLPRRPLTRGPIKQEDALKRAAGRRARAGNRSTSGGVRSILGALPEGTATVCAKIVPQCEAEGGRPYSHHGMAPGAPPGKEGGMVGERSGLPRAPPRASTRRQGQGRLRVPCLPARCGHPLPPMAGLWRVWKAPMGAGRWCSDLQQRSWRVRRVCMVPQAQPSSAFRGEPSPPRIARVLLEIAWGVGPGTLSLRYDLRSAMSLRKRDL